MNRILSIETSLLAVDWEIVSRRPEFSNMGNRLEEYRAIYDRARATFISTVAARGIAAPVGAGAFDNIFRGDGRNDEETPLNAMISQSDELFLFVVTLGEGIVRGIGEAFRDGDSPGGWMLDLLASEGVERAADMVQAKAISAVMEKDSSLHALRYSPGYCGWHLSGQRKIFEYLDPAEIGVALTERFLMDPVKSVSGVIVVGPKEIHLFDNSYPCCARCREKGCEERMRRMA